LPQKPQIKWIKRVITFSPLYKRTHGSIFVELEIHLIVMKTCCVGEKNTINTIYNAHFLEKV